jgi:CheY-like chemotaxis protein
VRVLVVSEDEIERLRAVSALRLDVEREVEIVEATSGPHAHEILGGDGTIDVLVIDGDLRPQGGFSLLYALRARSELDGLPQVPAIVLIDREQDRWLADWAGANAVLVKPVATFALARAVEALEGARGAAHGATESSDQIADLVEAATRGAEAGLTP